RQPGAVGHRTDLLPDSGARFPLRPARVPPRFHPEAEPAHYGHGVRVGDGRQVLAGWAAHHRGPDDALAGRALPPAASPLVARRLAPPALSAALQSPMAVLLSGDGVPHPWSNPGGAADSGASASVRPYARCRHTDLRDGADP